MTGTWAVGPRDVGSGWQGQGWRLTGTGAQSFQAALQTQWSWMLQLCCCVEAHLKENTAYFQVSPPHPLRAVSPEPLDHHRGMRPPPPGPAPPSCARVPGPGPSPA